MSLYQMPSREERQSISDLIRQLVGEVRELIQQHIELTKTGVRHESKRLLKMGIFSILAVAFMQVMLIYLGSLLVIFMLMATPLRIVGATILTFGFFLLMGIVFLGLIYREVKMMQKDLQVPKV